MMQAKVNALTISEKYLFFIFSFLILSVTFVFPENQIITGTIINSIFFLSASFLGAKFLFPTIILPSLFVVTRGLLFGELTPFLFYFLPFIWLGNYILIFSFKKLINSNYFIKIVIPSLLKWLTLYLMANIYYSNHLVPKLFLQVMGTNQFITAFMGGIISLIIYKKIKHG